MPPVAADTPSWQQKPFIWNQSQLIVRCANVFKLLDGTYTETQPVSNAPFTAGWELLDTTVGDGGVYYGGHSYTVSAAEAAALTAAGYGPYIT